MKITIEIGSTEEKQLIESELRIIDKIFLDIKNPITEIIVPIDFDKTIKIHSNNEDFESIRDNVKHIVTGINIDTANGLLIIFSPILYTELFDTQTRIIIYMHETLHAINKDRFIIDDSSNPKENSLILLGKKLYDEYYCNRMSLEITDNMFNVKTAFYQEWVQNIVESYTNNLLEGTLYNQIKEQIFKFKYRIIGFENFFTTVSPLIYGVSLNFVYIFSCADVFPIYYEFINKLEGCRFFNSNTKKLINYFRKKYEDNNFNLNDCVNIIEEFLVNFGLRYENTNKGLYCRVDFI